MKSPILSAEAMVEGLDNDVKNCNAYGLPALTIELISSMNAPHSSKPAEGPEQSSVSNSMWALSRETFQTVSNSSSKNDTVGGPGLDDGTLRTCHHVRFLTFTLTVERVL